VVVTMPGAASAAVGISSTAAAINNPLSFMASSSYELERRSETDVPWGVVALAERCRRLAGARRVDLVCHSGMRQRGGA
jgi:hypothetical protein